jgi:amidase
MKPTWGLVPYTGSVSVEPMLDHIGLITSTVAGNEDMLRVVAETNSHAAASRGSTVPPRALGALRIGLLEEGFGLSNSDPAVDAAVREMAENLRGAGHIVSNLSVPEHRASRIIYAGIVCPGSALQFLFGGNPSLNPGVLHENGQRQAGAVTGRDGAHLPDTVRSLLLIGGASLLHDRGVSYARAQIMTASLRAAYDRALQEVDILLMPTVPSCAPRIPSRDSTREERLDRAVDMFTNTSAFNATGHPAMSVPCAQIGALPVGAMLVARHFNEDMIYAAGKAIEDLR